MKLFRIFSLFIKMQRAPSIKMKLYTFSNSEMFIILSPHSEISSGMFIYTRIKATGRALRENAAI